MFGWIKKIFLKCYNNRILRYIFYGGLATLVNLGTFYLLRYAFHVNMNVANVISVVAAILFAYFTNSRAVFRSRASNFRERFPEFVKFVGMRLFTMIIEVGGLPLLVNYVHMREFLAKFLIQFIVIALNYIFSKLIVFRRRAEDE